VGDGSGTGSPKDPCEEEPDAVRGNRGENVVLGAEEGDDVEKGEKHRPPRGEDNQAGAVTDAAGWVVVVTVVLIS
jgi:hypothetical protein